jgi:hypothetical protein
MTDIAYALYLVDGHDPNHDELSNRSANSMVKGVYAQVLTDG